jgi:hypothetical protein
VARSPADAMCSRLARTAPTSETHGAVDDSGPLVAEMPSVARRTVGPADGGSIRDPAARDGGIPCSTGRTCGGDLVCCWKPGDPYDALQCKLPSDCLQPLVAFTCEGDDRCPPGSHCCGDLTGATNEIYGGSYCRSTVCPGVNLCSLDTKRCPDAGANCTEAHPNGFAYCQ